MLSIDSTNTALADANPDLDIAIVYQGEQDLAMLEKYKDQTAVILPMIINKRSLDAGEVAKLPEWAKEKTCPIDAGYVQAQTKTKPGWNCTKCDHGSGLPGCFFGKSTEKVLSKLPLDLTMDEIKYRVEDLKKFAEEIPNGRTKKRFHQELDLLISEIRRGSDPGAA